MKRAIILFFIWIFLHKPCVARVGIQSSINDPISIKMLNPGYILNTLQALCLKFYNDIDLLVEHDELYQEWIIKSDYLIDLSLELYMYVCYILMFKYELHSYLQEDTAYIINIVQQASEHYKKFMHQHMNDTRCILLLTILQKVVDKTLFLVNLTKEVNLEAPGSIDA